MTMNYREFVEFIKGGVEHVGQGFSKPDDDWMPVAFVDFHDEPPTAFGLPLEAFATPDTKDGLAFALGKACEMLKPTKFGMLTSCWMLKMRREEAPEDGENLPVPSEHPDRIEAVVLHVVDAERIEIHTAEIKRRKRKPPTLGPWERMDERGEAFFTGRFIDTLRGALR